MPISVGISLFLSAPAISFLSASFIVPFLRVRILYVRSTPSTFPFSTYSRLMMVEIVGAYVEGRPIPSSSILRTSAASVYLGGRCVNRSVAVVSCMASTSPSFMGGSIPSSFSPFSSSVPSKYTRKKPSNLITSPFATNFPSLFEIPILAVVRSSSASAICEAMVRFQISS